MRQFTGRLGEKRHMIFTALLYVIVNLLLIKGVSGLMRKRIHVVRLTISAVLSGAYVTACLITNNVFLCSAFLYLLTVFIIAFSAFGLSWSCVFSYVLLYVSLGGVYIKRQAALSLFVGTVGIALTALVASLCHDHKYVDVELRYKNMKYKFNALLDTGNLLRDPVSGSPVLIVGADIAQEMTGLTIEQLKSPVTSINTLPGARLIPYKTIGQSGVFLLGIYVPYLKVDAWQGSGIVALSPELLGTKCTYQALTGGYV
jgi:hypothetical protein